MQLPPDGQAGQQLGPSRVAAVGPYIQSSTMPRGPARHDLLVKPAYPDGTATLPAQEPQSKAGTGEKPETTSCLSFHPLTPSDYDSGLLGSNLETRPPVVVLSFVF